VRVLSGGRSYPDSVAVERGPQVLAAEESLNPGGVKSPGRGAVVLRTVPVPAGWSGSQVYSAGPVTLVPFADAMVMKVWLPAK